MSGLKAPEGNNNFVKQDAMEAGSYPARVVRVVDWGVQPPHPQDKFAKGPVHKISVTYEFGEEFIKDEDGNDVEDKPRWLAEQFPLRPLTSDLATSTARSKAIDVDNQFDGDWSQYLGLPCEPVIVVNDNGYNKIKGVNPLRKAKAAKLAPLVNDAFFFDLANPNKEDFEKLPKWEQAQICKNVNFKGSKLYDLLGGIAVTWEKGQKQEEKKADEPKQTEQEQVDNDPSTGDDDAPW